MYFTNLAKRVISLEMQLEHSMSEAVDQHHDTPLVFVLQTSLLLELEAICSGFVLPWRAHWRHRLTYAGDCVWWLPHDVVRDSDRTQLAGGN